MSTLIIAFMESEADFARLIKKKSAVAPIAMHKNSQTISRQIDDQANTTPY